MHRYGLTPKVPQKVHINRASRDAVRSWQYHFGRRVLCLEEKGFTILDMDEVFFVYDVASGRRYYPRRVNRCTIRRKPQEDRALWSHAKYDRQFFRMRELFDAPTFVWHIKELQRRFRNVATVMDRAFPYCTNAIKKLLRENKASRSPTFRRDPHISTRLRNAGAKESRFCSYQNTIERLLTCARSSSRIIGL